MQVYIILHSQRFSVDWPKLVRILWIKLWIVVDVGDFLVLLYQDGIPSGLHVELLPLYYT